VERLRKWPKFVFHGGDGGPSQVIAISLLPGDHGATVDWRAVLHIPAQSPKMKTTMEGIKEKSKLGTTLEKGLWSGNAPGKKMMRWAPNGHVAGRQSHVQISIERTLPSGPL
jgi:hypothetical protein